MTNAMPNPFWQLPPIPAPPNDPTLLLLDGRVGWQAAELDDVGIAGDNLGLLIVPGSGRLLDEPSGSFGGVVPPANVAWAPNGDLYMLDCQAAQLKRFDPCNCQFNVVPCLGGIGSKPRQLQDPHGIGVCSGNLFICDTSNNRLLVFSLFGLALRSMWTPPASAALANQWQPYDVAFDGHGKVYVTDPANGKIHCFHPSGRWERAFDGFGAVRWIAIDCQNRIYSVSGGEATARITGCDGKPQATVSRPEQIASYFPRLAFRVDAQGDLDLSSICKPAGSNGVFDPQGNPVADPGPDPPAVFQTSGTYWSAALDSQFYRCQWHRIMLRAQLPPKTAIQISTYASEVQQPFSQVQLLPDDAWQTNLTVTAIGKEWDALIFSSPGRYLWLRLQLSGNGSATPVVQSIRLEYPRISLRRYLPAVFAQDPGGTDFADRFLSIFDTTLRSVERKIDNQAAYFDPLSAPATPVKPGQMDFLTWLASWVGVSLDRQMPVAQRRTVLKRAGKFLCIRATRIGLWRQLLLFLRMEPKTVCCPHDQPKSTCNPQLRNCAPVVKKPCAWQPPPLILENYQLRRWMFLGQGRLGDDAVLWGMRIVNRSQLSRNAQAGVTQLITTPDPFHDPFLAYSHKFTVFVPASFGASDQKRRALINLLEAEKPAHTQYQVEYVAPRLRIGFQSMIGLDSVVGRYPSQFRIGQQLGKDSIVSGLPLQGGPSLAVGRTSRIGSGTKLD